MLWALTTWVPRFCLALATSVCTRSCLLGSFGLLGGGAPGGLGDQSRLVDPGLGRGDALPGQLEPEVLLRHVLLAVNLVLGLGEVVRGVVFEILRREPRERLVDLTGALGQRLGAAGVVLALPCGLFLGLGLLLRVLVLLGLELCFVKRLLLGSDVLLGLDLLIGQVLAASV